MMDNPEYRQRWEAKKAFYKKNGIEEGRNAYYRDLKEMINTLHNVVSISTWTPFNEGWGQFDSLKAVEFIRNLDI